MAVAPLARLDFVTPGGSFVVVALVSDFAVVPPSASVSTVVGCVSLSTGNSLSVPAARSGTAGACRTGGVYDVRYQTYPPPARSPATPSPIMTRHPIISLLRFFFGATADGGA